MDMDERIVVDSAAIRDMPYAVVTSVSAAWGWNGSEAENLHRMALDAGRAMLDPSTSKRVARAERAFRDANRDALYRDLTAPDWPGWACEDRVALAATAALVADLARDGDQDALQAAWSKRIEAVV